MSKSPTFLLLTALSSCVTGNIPFWNASLPWQVRVDDVVGRMTIDEIQTQLSSRQGVSPPIPSLGIGAYAWWSNCERGDVTQNATSFPQAIGLGASFDTDLVYRVAEASSMELRAYYNYFKNKGVPMGIYRALSCLSPNLDLARDPRWGRVAEVFSEDPYHGGEIGYHHVLGMQGSHPRYARANAQCKHFDVSGGPDDWPVSGQVFNAEVSERDWRSYFLPTFRRCVEAGTYSISCSPNSINGVPACANKKLLTDILRGEWNFTGYVIADVGAILNIMTKQHYMNNTVDLAAACLNAGCNLEMPSGNTRVYDSIIDAIKQGKLTEGYVREQVKPLMYTRLRLGEFDPKEMNPYNYLRKNDVVLSVTHRALAIEAAVKSFVLLKNNNFLPLNNRFDKIAVVGPMANNTEQIMGDYTANPDPSFIVTALHGLTRLGNTTQYAAGCSTTYCTDYKEQDIVKAVDGVDVVFVCLGTGQAIEAQGKDRHNITLPGSQLQLIKDVIKNTDKPIVLLLFNGGPLEMEWAVENPRITAILECFLPGQSAGDAILVSLTATSDSNIPAARLPYTWPMNDSQIPAMVNYSMEGRTYRHFTGDPTFPFGYGLSYTTFRYSDFVCPASVQAGQGLTCRVTVANTGQYTADEVSQVYLSWQNTSLPVPRIQLVGFSRNNIEAGGSTIYGFTIDPRNMAVWTDHNGWVVLPGKMNIYVGGQQPNQRRSVGSNVLNGMFQITDSKILGKF